MDTIGKRIKDARKKVGLSQVDLAEKIGVSKQTLYKYENDIITNIPSNYIEEIAKNTGVSPAYIMGWSTDPRTQLPSNIRPVVTKKIPMLGNIACGEPIFAEEQHEYTVDLSADINADFCLRAKGDSMTGDRIYDGDIVFIRSQPTVENGEIAAVLVGDEATLKRVKYDQAAGILQLFPSNPKHPIQTYSGHELDNIRIIGKAIICQFDI